MGVIVPHNFFDTLDKALHWHIQEYSSSQSSDVVYTNLILKRIIRNIEADFTQFNTGNKDFELTDDELYAVHEAAYYAKKYSLESQINHENLALFYEWIDDKYLHQSNH